MSATVREIESQPQLWHRATAMLAEIAPKPPASGQRLAIIGCGTSFHIVQAVAVACALSVLPPDTPSLGICAVDGTAVVDSASDAVLLPFADEESIIQTRFATTVLALLRAHLGEDLAGLIAEAEAASAQPLPLAPS